MTRLGIIDDHKLRKNRRIGYFIVACIGVALPGVDPVTTMVETIPLLILFEASIWLSVLLDRRLGTAEGRRVLRDVTGRSPPAGCFLSTARQSKKPSSPGRTAGSPSSGRPRVARQLRGASSCPGIVNAHSHLEYAV